MSLCAECAESSSGCCAQHSYITIADAKFTANPNFSQKAVLVTPEEMDKLDRGEVVERLDSNGALHSFFLK